MFSSSVVVSLPKRLLHPENNRSHRGYTTILLSIIDGEQFPFHLFYKRFLLRRLRVNKVHECWLAGSLSLVAHKAAGKCDPYYITEREKVQIVECLWSCECNDKRDRKEHQHYPPGTFGFISHTSYPVTSLHQWNWLNVKEKKNFTQFDDKWGESPKTFCVLLKFKDDPCFSEDEKVWRHT